MNNVIYVKLVDEIVYALRPILASKINDSTFKIEKDQEYDKDIETWEFEPGTIVRCEKRIENNQEFWVAVEKLDLKQL